MKSLHVLFYKPDPGDHWLNHLVTALSPPFSHCDLQFADGTATSIYQNEPVYMHNKGFSRLNYEIHSVAVTEEEHHRALSFCKRHHENKTSFDGLGMILSMSPLSLNRCPRNKTFCSRYVTEALKATGRDEFMGMDPCRTTPSSLYRILYRQNKGFLHLPDSRMKLI